MRVKSCMAAAGALLMGGCLPLALVPTELDRRLGAQTAKEVTEQMGLYHAPTTEGYVRAIGERLVGHLETKQFQFVFNLVDQQEPNAFAEPGGYIYVSRGLLALANSEAELAGVLGHEISHVTRRHSVRQSQKGTLPRDLLTTNPKDLYNLSRKLKLSPEMRIKMMTSVDTMSPEDPVLQALATLPIVPEVKAHSIIAVEGHGDPTKGNDGVVAYTSAHLDGVESEYIVRSEHSCQANPPIIEEVRQILLVHLSTLH